MKRLLYPAWLLLAIAVFFAIGFVLSAVIPLWFLSEAAILGLVLAAALLLPGSSALWTELLGTTATLPVLWRILPCPLVLAMPFFVPEFLLYTLYHAICLFIATIAPMFLLLLCGRLLK